MCGGGGGGGAADLFPCPYLPKVQTRPPIRSRVSGFIIIIIIIIQFSLVQLGFNVHIQSKLLYHTPVMGTHSSYQLGCLSRTED